MKNCAVCTFDMGSFYIESEDKKIVAINYMDKCSEYDFCEEPDEITDMAARQLQEYFNGKRRSFDFPYKLKGTEFQIKVWNELIKIPYGETRSYKQIAEAIGNPKACRAVGMANNHNPILIAVPCHRVIGADGSLTGFRCGLDIKRELLKREYDSLKAEA